MNFVISIYVMLSDFKTFSFEKSKFVGERDGQNKIALKILL